MAQGYSDNPIIKDIELFRESLWQLCIKNSTGMSGEEVIRALESITDDLYSGGIDEAYDNTEIQNPDSIASLWDCIWLSSFARRLLKLNKKVEK